MFLLFLMCSCEAPMEDPINIDIKHDGDLVVSISIENGVSTVAHDNPKYFKRVILESAANGLGYDSYALFEQGENAYENSQYNHEAQNIFELRELSTGKNNFDKLYSYNYPMQSGQTLEYDVTLTGNPLYLHIALENESDPGGAKLWEVDKLLDPDRNPLVDLGQWECFVDNKYVYMKGRRCFYYPGDYCDRETDELGAPPYPDRIGASYSITEDQGGNVFLSINLPLEDGSTRSESFEILASSFSSIEAKVKGDNGEEAIAIFKPTGYPDEL